MTTLFLQIVNMSISAGWLMLAVLILRFLLKRAPKWVDVLLWGIVALRLICPFSIESAFSLIPSTQTVSPAIMTDWTPEIATGISSLDAVVNPVITATFAPEPWASANPLQILIPVWANLWLLGILAMLGYTAVSYLLLRRKVATAVLYGDNIFQSEYIGSPFVLGIIRPRIYLPFRMEGAQLEHVIAHEQAHIARKDHWWKPLGFLLLTLHWFNPLMWLCYVLLCRDIELACDEKVIRELGSEERADYTQALVSCSVSRSRIAACPLAFGEVGVKERVKSVLNYKKPSFWMILLAIVLCIAVAVCFLTNPVASVRNPWVREYVPGEAGILGTVDKETYESISEDFAIGADRYGRAVFKNPRKAFDTFTTLYAQGISLIQEENDLRPISKSHYNAYKKLGWQTTSGSEEAREQAAFVTKFLDIYENSFTKEVPTPDTEIPTADTWQPLARKWFDDTSAPYLNGEMSLEIPEIPGVTFRATAEEITVDGETVIQGMPICSAYFCDLTADGVPELCTNVYWGSGIIDSHVIVYDYAQRASYELADRGLYDFYLHLNVSDGCLYVQQRNHTSEVVLDHGKLIFQNGTLQMEPSYLLRVHYLYVRILEIVGDSYLVEPAQGSMLAGVVDKITVPMENLEASPEPRVGDLIEVQYDGTLMESYPAQIGTVYGIRVVQQQEEKARYFLTIGEAGIFSVEYSGKLFSGGFQNADGSAFQAGERIWLEGLDGLTDLRGVTVEALDEYGHTVWTISIADTDENRGIKEASGGVWMIRSEE